jgi:hypothetical protein
MKIPLRQPCRRMIILTIIVGMLIGCTSVFQNLDDRMHRNRFKLDYEAFEKALAVYKEGDCERAHAQFKTLSTVSASEKIARKARLGEICCGLMMAKTQAEYTDTIGMWHDFVRSAPEDDTVWDMALLDPLMVRMTPKHATQMIKIHMPAAEISAETVAPADRQLEAELEALKDKVAHAEQLQRKMDAVVAENRSLKEKIKALEAIDQNIQKKKTAISAPSE